MVRELVREGRLHRKGLVQKLFVKSLFGLVHHDHGDGAGVELGPTRPSHHLEHVRDWKIHVPTGLAVVKFRALDDHEVRGEVHAPRQRRRAHQHLNLALEKELLAERPVLGGQTRVVQPDPELQRVPQLG